MSILVPVLLTFLALSACQDHVAALPHISNLLQESIKLLSELETKVSCDKMNVTNIFADNENADNMEILCKATTVTWEGRSCHRDLEAVYLNLFSLVQSRSSIHKAPCPVAAGNTTSLNIFLQDLRKVLQRLVKYQHWK